MTKARTRHHGKRDAAAPGTSPKQAAPRAAKAAAQASPAPPPRNQAIDSLRGLAIILMIADHVAGILLRLPLDSEVRFVTRLAEPLFVVTFGYLLANGSRTRILRRLPRILGAALVVNLLFFPAYQSFEILVTLLAVSLLYLGLGRHLVFLAPIIFLQRWDPTGGVLDYLLTVVASQVALGMLLHHRRALLFIALYLTPLVLADATGAKRIAFTVVAALAVWFAARSPRLRLPGLELLGRHPLKVYVAQFLLVFGIGWVIDAPSIGRIAQFYGLRAAPPRIAGEGDVAPPDPALPCLGPSLPLSFVRDLPMVELTVAQAHGAFLIDFATTDSTLDPGQLEGPRPKPLPGSTNRWERVHFFGRWPGAQLEPQDYASFQGPPRRAGIIGTDFLATGAFTIDWTARRLHRADPATLCDASTLRRAGLRPLSSLGYYAQDPSRLTHSNVPVVPVRIGTAMAPAQLDTGYDDGVVRHSLNVNQAWLDAIIASGVALTRAPELDLNLRTCTGARQPVLAYRLPTGVPVELVGEDGASVRRYPSAVLFLKGSTPETRICGGIGTWDEPAAQLGVSFMADAGRVLIDPVGARVWLPADASGVSP